MRSGAVKAEVIESAGVEEKAVPVAKQGNLDFYTEVHAGIYIGRFPCHAAAYLCVL